MTVAGVTFSLPFVCLSVFPHNISKTNAAKITKLEMFHHESCKLIYFAVKKSKVRVARHKNIVGMGIYTLVSAGFFRSILHLSHHIHVLQPTNRYKSFRQQTTQHYYLTAEQSQNGCR